ncbi:hypothetical protein N7G274_006229 [Stereocaulon virgatum]|uniref:RNase III domain-containing protein n=1 Tax=Stereocaulon virgatum TaxID=373712 RepID=A0ABR4A788_9LECA
MATTQASKIRGVENIIGYKFNDPLILWEALQPAGSGVTFAGSRRFLEGNKRLAMLGDAVLNVALLDDWYGGAGSRRQATAILQDVSANANLDRVARSHGLDNFVCLDTRAQGHRVMITQMTATVEAILGGVWLDGGLEAVKGTMINLGLVPS